MKKLNGNKELCMELAQRSQSKNVYFIGIGDDSESIPLKDYKWITTQYNELFVQYDNCNHFLTPTGRTIYILFYDNKLGKFVPQKITKSLILNFRRTYDQLKNVEHVGLEMDIDKICTLLESNLDRFAKILRQIHNK
jgi:hypothetical protein